MRLFVASIVALASSHAFAGPATCSLYTAKVAKTGQSAVIKTHVAGYDREVGYTDVGTTIIVGKRIKSCDKAFSEDGPACGIKVIDVKEVSNEDCWD